MPKVIMLSVTMLSVSMLSVIMLSVIMLSVIMLSVVASARKYFPNSLSFSCLDKDKSTTFN